MNNKHIDKVSYNFAILISLIIFFPIPLVYQAGTKKLYVQILTSLFISMLYLFIESVEINQVKTATNSVTSNLFQRMSIDIHKSTVQRLRMLLTVLLLLSVLVMFDGTNIALRETYNIKGDDWLWDQSFVNFDTFMLGWLFPKGQLSLFLDKNIWIGTRSFLGVLYAEYLQLAYASYYIWGNGLAAYMLWEYYKSCQLRKEKQILRSWRRIEMFLCAWIGAYILNFAMNQMFPAVSPRIYIADDYQTELKGLFLANIIRNKIKQAAQNSFTVFPSGHCGLTMTAMFIAKRLGYKRYAKIAVGASISIVTATLVLRYHYFADFFFAPLLIMFGLKLGNMLTQKECEATLLQDTDIITNEISV